MALNPAQQQVIDLLGAQRRGRPEFASDLAGRLRSELEDGLAPLADAIDSSGKAAVYLSKHTLGKILDCERCFLAERAEPFAWSPPLARGSVSHKAIELALHWRSEPDPLQLVDESIARLAGFSDSLGRYLSSCSEVERAELRSESNQRVAKFLECFPPLKTAWTPVTESSLRAEFLGGRVVLSGRPDLTLGQPDGNAAGKVVIDFKSGGSSPVHPEDLRFYALLETLRVGVPPRMLSTYYLDSGSLQSESVTVERLGAAVDRVLGGALRYADVTAGHREPDVTPGRSCRWCPVRSECPEGSAHIEACPSPGE